MQSIMTRLKLLLAALVIAVPALAQAQIDPSWQITGVSGTPTGSGALVLKTNPSLIGLTMGGNVGLGANHLSYGGTAAGLSFNSSNNATLSAGVTANGQTTINTGAVKIFGQLDAAQLSANVFDWQIATNSARFLSYGPTGVAGQFTWTTAVGGGAATVPMTLTSAGLAVAGTTSSTSFADSGGHLLISSTAPTIDSGFGTSPILTAANTAAFQVNVGTGGTATNGTINLPAAPNNWACGAVDMTNVTISDTVAVPVLSTQIILINYHRTTGVLAPWTAGDVIVVHCTAE